MYTMWSTDNTVTSEIESELEDYCCYCHKV